MCIWSIIAKCCTLRKEFAHQLCCLRPLPGVTDRTRMRKGGRKRRMRGRKPGQHLRVFPCWSAPPTQAARSTQLSNRLLCFPPANVSVNHSPQQKGMIFVYKCAPFGAVQHAFIHPVHVMHDKLWNNNWKSGNNWLLLWVAQDNFLFTKWKRFSFKHSETACKTDDRPISRHAIKHRPQTVKWHKSHLIWERLLCSPPSASCISMEKSITDYLSCGRTTFS